MWWPEIAEICYMRPEDPRLSSQLIRDAKPKLRKEVKEMREVCYCGRTGEIEDPQPILDGDGRWALRCPNEACGHLDYLGWLPDEAGLLLWGEAKQSRGTRHVHLSGRERAA